MIFFNVAYFNKYNTYSSKKKKVNYLIKDINNIYTSIRPDLFWSVWLQLLISVHFSLLDLWYSFLEPKVTI